MTTTSGAGGQFVENNFYGQVDARGALFGIVNGGSGGAPDPPRTVAEAARLLFGNPPRPAPGSPVSWLDPRAGIVPARRRPGVAELVAWCTGAAGPMVRLVCGPGGQGKTRLGLDVCQALAPRGSGRYPTTTCPGRCSVTARVLSPPRTSS